MSARIRGSARELPPRAGGRGQALAEFALVAPVFFLLLFGIIEGGRFIFYYEILNNATREGARYAIVHGYNSFDCTGPSVNPSVKTCDSTGADVVSSVKAAAYGTMGSNVNVAPSWLQTDGVTPGNNGRGMTVKVVATYSYASLVPIVPLPPITVTAESRLVINN